jgi:hypothetical protein
MNRQVSLTISDVDVSNLFTRDHFHSELLGGVVETKIHLVLSKDIQGLGVLDLNGKVLFKVTHGDSIIYRFGGVVTHTEQTASEYILHCKDPNQYLNYLRREDSALESCLRSRFTT